MGERQTEDLKVPSSFPGLGIISDVQKSEVEAELNADQEAQRLRLARFSQSGAGICLIPPLGLMAEASASGAGESRFESWVLRPFLAGRQSRSL